MTRPYLGPNAVLPPVREYLASYPVAGASWFDGPLKDALERLICDTRASTADRLWALGYLLRIVCGIEGPMPTEADLTRWCGR